MIVFVRIDDRLIHGQVVEGWVNFLKATCLLVADDSVASNALQRSIMELSVPQGLKVFIGRVEEVCGRIRTSVLDAERAILLRALNSGMECRNLNIGGMHLVPGKRKLLDVLAVNATDMEALKEITSKGVKIMIQTVPTQRPIPLDKVLDACSVEEKL
jgi:PTS system mannose-specific IIB component